MINVGIVLGSTRPGRKGAQIANWVLAQAQKRGDAEYDLVDIGDFSLPLLDEPVPPSMNRYSKEHTKAWAMEVAAHDAFVFVTPEYNHSIPAALKNALDFLYKEWNNKAAGFVGYGSAGGVRAVEALRLVMAELQIADVRSQVLINLASDFENYMTFRPKPHHEQSLKTMLDQILAWGAALKGVRR